MTERVEKINDLIRDRLSMIFSREISFKKGVFVSISRVETTPDLRSAKVFVSVFPEKDYDYVMKTLEKEKNKIQKKLNQKLVMKIFPQVRFLSDKTQIKVDELETLFEQIRKEREE